MTESSQESENKFTHTDPQYWVERWELNEIGFHKDSKNQ